MKKWSFYFFLLFLLLLSCKKIDRTSPHARILLRETQPTTTTIDGYILLKEVDKDAFFEKLDSTFLSLSLVTEVLKNIGHPKYKDPAYIKSRTLFDRFENGTIDISIYINDPEFSCQLLDSLVIKGLERLKLSEKLNFEKEMDGYKDQLDSLQIALTKTDEAYRNETDVFEKNQLYKKQNRMEKEYTHLIEEKMEKELTHRGMPLTQNEFVIIYPAKFIRSGR